MFPVLNLFREMRRDDGSVTREKATKFFELLKQVCEIHRTGSRDVQERVAFMSLVCEFLMIFMADYDEESRELCCSLHIYITENWPSTNTMDALKKAGEFCPLVFHGHTLILPSSHVREVDAC
jgi:hypothetical protein